MSTERDLQFEHIRGQATFIYFLMGISASAIAFAIHETGDRTLAQTPWPIWLGVGLWGLSFLLGCLAVGAHQRGIRSNVAFLRATGGLGVNATRPEFAAMVKEAEKETQKDLNKAPRRQQWQQLAMFAGAVAYIAGHVMAMEARGHPTGIAEGNPAAVPSRPGK